MNQWVLVMVLHISGPPGDLRDPTMEVLDGFSSHAKCDAGGRAIAEALIGSVGRARIGQGIQGEGRVQIPKIQYQCIEVQK